MESLSDNNSPVSPDNANADVPTVTEEDHIVSEPDQISLVSVVFVGSETWVTDFNKLEVSKKIMERLSTIEANAVQDPSLDDICAGKDPTDGHWYRVKVVSLQPAVTVHYIDFGNECEISPNNLSALPDELKLEPPLAKKSILKWINPCLPEVVPSAGDVLEVKYDGKEADGTLKLEVLAIKGISDHDECLSDEEKPEEHLLCDDRGAKGTDTEQVENGCSAVTENVTEFECPPDSIQQMEEVEAASNLREEAHSTVQEILMKLDEELPKQNEVAMQARLEVEKTMKEIDGRLPLQEEVAMQTRLEVQKIMEGLDERLHKQQEAALASMRQMMEKALTQSLNKIDRIQKDLHKLYTTSKQQQLRSPAGANEAERSTDIGNAFLSNHYSRPNATMQQFSPDKRHHNKFAHFGEEQPAGLHHHGNVHGGNAHGGNTHGGNTHGGPSAGGGLLSPRMGVRDSRNLRDPNAMQSYNVLRDGNATRDPNTLREPNAVPYVQIAMQDQGGNSRRSVSLRLRQAGDYNVVTSTTILSVNNLPEIFTCDYLCTLFGLYGNLSRAKLLFNQKGKALVEMADAAQAAATTKMLDGTQMFGQTIHVRPSTFDKLNISPTELSNNTAIDITRLNSYQANSIRRFRKGFWDPSKLVAPSETLRVSNILKTVPDEKVSAAFTDKGFVFRSIHFLQGSADKKTAFVVFSSIDDAFRALHELHNTELSDWMPMKINFGVSK